ncbi:unnamed protein product [Victoria cruziana]
MKRPANGEKNLERLLKWREMCPEIVVRSTFIAGFPGETQAEFDYLLDFLREARIDRAGCFAYSPIDGAPANELPGALPDEVREARRAQFMAVAEEVSIAKLQSRVGATMQVLVDSAPAMGRKGGVGRTYADAPEIDGTVRLLPPQKASKTLKVGLDRVVPRRGRPAQPPVEGQERLHLRPAWHPHQLHAGRTPGHAGRRAPVPADAFGPVGHQPGRHGGAEGRR